MLTKNIISHINQLKLKKNREQSGEFIAEGSKIVYEFLNSGFYVKTLYATSKWLYEFQSQKTSETCETTVVSDNEMERISQLKTATDVLAIISIPEQTFSEKQVSDELSLVLDNIQDPGNLGTIIRTADWFGIKNIFCSENTVDLYNPKVVQATMGSITRVKVIYTDLISLLESVSIKLDIPVYGTFLEGANIYEQSLSKNGFVIMGSEGSGISDNIAPFINEKLFIPAFNNGVISSESLNVSIATAVICSEFRRRYL